VFEGFRKSDCSNLLVYMIFISGLDIAIFTLEYGQYV